MRRTQLFSFLAIITLLLGAQVALAQDAYSRAYDLGFRMGQDDARAGRASNFERFTVYREGLEGWNGVGSREQYRASFQSGFRSGYQSGYSQTGGVATSGAGSVLNRSAFRTGYREGFNDGQRASGGTYNPTNNDDYQNATVGYSASRHGNIEDYRRDFRHGYQAGYDDGFNRRDFNAEAAFSRVSSGAVAATTASTAINTNDPGYVNGYRAGYTEGENDRNSNAAFRATQNHIYQSAVHGYNARRHGSVEGYKLTFRQGFEVGYDDGYYGRAAQMRRDAPRGFGRRIPGAGVTAGGNLIVVPANTVIRMRLETPLSTKTSKAGDSFTATVTDPVYAQGSSEVAIPQGSTVKGAVTLVERAPRIGGDSQLQLRYESITLPGGSSYQLQASTEGVSSDRKVEVDPEERQIERSTTKRDVGTIAAGAAIGAIIGGIAGGGKGAGIGAAIGSAGGLGAILINRGARDLELPAGTAMEIRLQNGLELRR